MREDLSPGDDANRQLVFIGVVTTFLSLLPTLYAAAISNSVLLFADALRCTTEFLAIFLSWFVLTKSNRAESTYYNYGFGKLEQLSSIAVGGALLISFLLAVVSAIIRIVDPVPVMDVGFGLSLAILSVLGNAYLWQKNYFLFVKQPSPVIDSQWRLFRAKTFATVVVSVSLAGTLVFPFTQVTVYFDPCGSLLLSGFLLYSAYTVLVSSVPDLVDRAVAEGIQLIILQSLIDYEKEYLGLEKVRTRRAGSKIFVDIFLSFEPNVSLGKVHQVVMLIKKSILSKLNGAEVVVIPSAENRVGENKTFIFKEEQI